MERKTQMLIDKKTISDLFEKGRSNKAFPLIMFYKESNTHKVLFSVSKKKIKRAVDRNRIKRHLKAIYFNDLALNQIHLPNQTIAFVYMSNKPVKHIELKTKMKKLMEAI